MRKIKIITDSCSDLDAKLMETYDIDYARMNTVYQEKEKEASLTWEYYTPKKLYDIMRNGERVLTTQVPIAEYTRIYKKYLDEGCDIIYIGCSLKQSGSVNTGDVVAKDVLEDYPDARITCIDSLNACIGEGMLAIYAAELVAAGKDYDEIVEAVMEKRNHVNEYVTVHSLDALKRAGRVKASSAFFGNLMSIKPILISDADGEQTPIKKSHGRAKSLKDIVSLLAGSIEDPEEQTIYIAHADCNPEELETLKQLVKENINCKDIYTVYIGPIIGASIGPDAIGVWGFGKEVTYRVGAVSE
ncbi:MAG: DegV family protein [Eubacterium sp.]|nr:DegV family protein [Eubacterium sp.]